jgi:hypothetical protein
MEANLQEAMYEPHPGKLPNFWTLADPDNKLETLLFYRSPAALIALREAFKRGGMRTQERQVTYAIEHIKRLQAWNPSWFDPEAEDPRPWLEQLAGKSESLFSYVLFELPSGYGMVPSRALATLGLLIFVFSLVYMVALVTARGRAGIWVTWPTDRVYQEEGATEATRVTTTFFFPRWQARAAGRWWGVLLRGVSVPLIGLYFSLLSAFSLGWRELNVGTWITRVQSREYVLRATGWVRTVSGIQSLLSVYLLALWVLTYFGRSSNTTAGPRGTCTPGDQPSIRHPFHQFGVGLRMAWAGYCRRSSAISAWRMSTWGAPSGRTFRLGLSRVRYERPISFPVKR